MGKDVAVPVDELGMFDHITLITYGSESIVFTSRQDDIHSVCRFKFTYIFSVRVSKVMVKHMEKRKALRSKSKKEKRGVSKKTKHQV